MKHYAVTWCIDGGVDAGRLDVHRDRFELHGRSRTDTVPFADVRRATIARGRSDRLRGLPVLRIETGDGPVCIASLQGAGTLHELSALVERAGLTVAS